MTKVVRESGSGPLSLSSSVITSVPPTAPTRRRREARLQTKETAVASQRSIRRDRPPAASPGSASGDPRSLDIMVTCHAEWLAAAFCHWLNAQTAFSVRSVSDSHAATGGADLWIALDSGSDDWQAVLPRPLPDCPRLYVATALTARRLLMALRLDAAAILTYSDLDRDGVATLITLIDGMPARSPSALLQSFPCAEPAGCSPGSPSHPAKLTV